MRIACVVLLALTACTAADDIDSVQRAAGNGIKSQLRGYDLGPPFPAGFRDSGLINGYDEGEWIPFVAVMDGRKLEKADANEGSTGDGAYRATIIIPTYSPRNEANGISDLAVAGTYGEGDLTPIPSPFDDRWLVDNGYAPFVLGAYSDSDVDVLPEIAEIRQRSGPTRFGGDVASAAVTVTFVSGAAAERVELRFAIRLAPPGLAPIGPGGQAFPGGESGAAAGAAAFHPGPGPLFAGYEVGDPTGIATVPIKVEHNDCDGDDDCVPGEYCGAGGDCEEPCASDVDCPTEEICEDGVCVPPPPVCEEDADCNGDYCVGGYCVPDCPDECADPEFCDPEPCLPPDGPPPCVVDEQCPGGDVCEDGVCTPPTPPCDVSCPEDDVCVDDYCVPPGDPCTDDLDCPGGEVCVGDVCEPGDPPCEGPECAPCDADDDCPGGTACIGGVCIPLDPPVPCTDVAECPTGDLCAGGYCVPPPPPCRNHHDCDADDVCGSDKVCVPPGSEPCTDSAECPGDDECIGGFCLPPRGCERDETCPGGELCEDGTCRPGDPPAPCTVDADCPPTEDDVFVPVCYGGFCTPGGGDCADDADCPGGTACLGGQCLPLDDPAPCVTQYDCGGGAVCVGGVCEPTDSPDECTTGDDCPPNPEDDVVACIGGVCTSSRIAPPSCSIALDCSPGTDCRVGVCEPIAGACELDADCGAGGCVDGWCGTACTEAAQCETGDVCAYGRCVAGCNTYAQCAAYESCLDGGCVPLPAYYSAGRTGDQSRWEVDVPGAEQRDVSGGCATAPASGDGANGLWLVALLMPLGLRRRWRGARRTRWIAPLLVLALLAAACGDGDDNAGDDDVAADASAPAADAWPIADAGAPADADYSNSPFLLVSCGPGDDYADVDGGSLDGGVADAGPAPGVDDPCCNPTGACPGDLACIQGPSPEEHRCRPRCDLATRDCGAGGVCADFGGTGVCIPASVEGLDCAPELCDAATICVGSSADDAICRRRCAVDTDCDAGQSCTNLTQTDVKACL